MPQIGRQTVRILKSMEEGLKNTTKIMGTSYVKGPGEASWTVLKEELPSIHRGVFPPTRQDSITFSTLKLGGPKRGPPPSLSLVSCAISPIAKVNGDHDGPHARQLDLFVIVYCKKIRDTSYNGV